MLRNVFVYPGIEFESIERDALLSYWYFDYAWTYFSIESVAIHSEVGWGIAETQHPWQ